MQRDRAVVRTAQLNTDEIVGLWSATLWVVAAAVLLATFQVY
ncbi:MAG TPA: hypothetical protein VIV34_03830 [Pseudolabrys sp.]